MGPGMNFLFFLGAVGWGVIFYFAALKQPPAPYINCGARPQRLVKHRNTRMIGGQKVGVEVWPWQVSVMYQTSSDAPFIHVCGGAIIQRYWIMTAAPCVHMKNQSALLIRAGSSRLDVDDKFTQNLEVMKIITHKRFQPGNLRYSIALLKMKTPFKINKFVYPICVADDSASDHKYESCHITGHNGQPGDDLGVLQEANVYLMSRSLCNKPEFWNYSVSADMLCAGVFTGDVAGCETNLGGPLNCYITIDRHYYLIGIQVDSRSCNETTRPNIFLKVYTLYYWIELETNITFH